MKRWCVLAIGSAIACSAADPSPGFGEGSAGTAVGDDAPLASSSDGSSTSGADSSTGGSTGSDIILDVGAGDDFDPPPVIPSNCEEAVDSATSVGCTFFPAAVPALVFGETAAFAVSNLSSEVATVTLSDSAGVVARATVEPGEVHIFDEGGQHQLPPETGITDGGYRIDSDVPLQAFQFMPGAASPTADASLVLPVQVLGDRHRVVTYDSGNDAAVHAVVVVATEDDTELTFTLAPGAAHTRGAPGTIPELDAAGDTAFTVTLGALETLVVYADNSVYDSNDLTGSLVETNGSPVAIYSGNPVVTIPSVADGGTCCADVVSTAVPPTEVWGSEYAGVKLLPMGNQIDVWRFVGDHAGTVVELSGGLTETIMLEPGEFRDVITSESFWASGSEPFGLVHMMAGGNGAMVDGGLAPHDAASCGEDNLSVPGDPAIVWAFAEENWLHRYLFPVGPSTEGSWCHDHATVVAPIDRWEELELVGGSLPAPEPIGDDGFGFAYVPLTSDRHEIVAPEDLGFEVTVAGYVDHGSYLYPGGLGFKPLNAAG